MKSLRTDLYAHKHVLYGFVITVQYGYVITVQYSYVIDVTL